eukprot:SAG31_NODE_26665_length_438_cov_1.061947_1_plen_90_part_01
MLCAGVADDAFVPLLVPPVGSKHPVEVGAVPVSLVQQLISQGRAFEMDTRSNSLSLHPDLAAAPLDVRTAAVAEVTASLRDDGTVAGWRC